MVLDDIDEAALAELDEWEASALQKAPQRNSKLKPDEVEMDSDDFDEAMLADLDALEASARAAIRKSPVTTSSTTNSNIARPNRPPSSKPDAQDEVITILDDSDEEKENQLTQSRQRVPRARARRGSEEDIIELSD